MKKVLIAIVVLVGLLELSNLSFFSSKGPVDSLSGTLVGRGVVVRKALAVGEITVEHEVPVKSMRGGILAKQFVTLGQKVKKGTPLAEVRPVVTSLDLVEIERSLKVADDGVQNAEEYLSGAHPAAVLARWMNGEENLTRMRRQAEVNKKQLEERLELLRQGRTEAAGRTIDYSVLAPVDGHVIEIVSREGAPVVSSSSYGSGTVLVVLADLDKMLFLGTVDEIDVGRLEEGMNARIRIGALPAREMQGTVVEIAMKSRLVNNASVFDVRIELEMDDEIPLRSGYSAVAEIELDRREDVLVVPERLVRFENDEAFVLIPAPGEEAREVSVELGLSDGLTVEIVAGLDEGDEVLERN